MSVVRLWIPAELLYPHRLNHLFLKYILLGEEKMLGGNPASPTCHSKTSQPFFLLLLNQATWSDFLCLRVNSI